MRERDWRAKDLLMGLLVSYMMRINTRAGVSGKEVICLVQLTSAYILTLNHFSMQTKSHLTRNNLMYFFIYFVNSIHQSCKTLNQAL